MSAFFSLRRVWAMTLKEAAQTCRDRPTLMMTLGIPIVQLVLFGYAINMDPKNLVTLVVDADRGPKTREVLTVLKNTGYFDVRADAVSVVEAETALRRGKTKFIVRFPPDFSRKWWRGESPSFLLEGDAVDPASIGNAMSAAETAVRRAFGDGAVGVALIEHPCYNPEKATRYHIVPCLLGLVLTLTMTFITALSITRETERGAIENLLCMPFRPLEILIGKILPYTLLGVVQSALIIFGSKALFDVPCRGSVTLLCAVTILFIASNLAVGVTFSTLARTQLQAVQMCVFFLLPSILLSGFMFPFEGMPIWAQTIGRFLPLTHFNEIVRGVTLKKASFDDVMPRVVALSLFMVGALTLAVTRFRKTLD